MKTHALFSLLLLRAPLINKGSKYLLLSAFLLLCFSSVSAQQLINNKGNRNQSYPVVTEKNPEIVALINQVSQDSIESYIRYMQQFERGSKTPEALIVQNWLIEHFESYGYTSKDIYVHSFSIGSQQLDAGNVVVFKEGTEFPDEYILITSHYDHSTFDILCGPGADDNASGTSGVMECARLLRDFPTKRSIMFVPFSGEEYWMYGSMPFAQKCASENMNIVGHFNMDMIGFFPASITETVMASGYSYISQSLFEYYQQTANIYIPEIPTIRLTKGDSYGGDHMPFNLYEYPSLYIGDIEYKDDYHPCYHEPCDTIGEFGGVNRLDLAKAFVQATLSAAAELANAWLPPQNLSACSGIEHINVFWDSSGENNSYKVFRNSKMVAETTHTFYMDYDVEVGKQYEYYVIDLSAAPSNKDLVTFVEPLILPYSNNFSSTKYGFEQSDWVLRSTSGKSSICNTSGSGGFSDNYLSIAELDWFSIPSNIENISIQFKIKREIRGSWNNLNENWYSAGLFFEVSNDRKTWNKLAHIANSNPNWINYKFSLNDFIGSDFFQARFRLESSGESVSSKGNKIVYITDIEVVFETDTTSVKETNPYFSYFNFTPNPASNYIYITTDQQESYYISVYDMMGKLFFLQDAFRDGGLDISFLAKGTYLIVASLPKHRVAKKLVVQ